MIVELFINGVVQGSLLALICIGYSLAYGSAQVINFAHADAMIAGGGYLVLLWIGQDAPVAARYGMPILFGLSFAIVMVNWLKGRDGLTGRRLSAIAVMTLAVVGLCGALCGRASFVFAALLAVPMTAFLATAIYYVGYRRLLIRGDPRTSVLLSSLGMSIGIQSCLLILWNSERRVFAPQSLPAALSVQRVSEGAGQWSDQLRHGFVAIGEHVWLPVQDLLIIVIFIAVATGLYGFFRLSRLADAIVATADSRLAARACGIPVDRVVSAAFFLGGAIASLGGTLEVLRAKSLHPQAGFSLGILAFAACVLGGIGSLRGSIIGAFLISLVMSMAPIVPLQLWVATLVPNSWLQWLPSLNLIDWSYGVIYAIMIVTILLKPQGLFAR